MHAEAQLATTDKWVALYRRMLRRAVRDLVDGHEPPQHRRSPDGKVPIMAGEVIVRASATNRDNVELQRIMGREIGRVVHETTDPERIERWVEIERRVRDWLATSAQAKEA